MHQHSLPALGFVRGVEHVPCGQHLDWKSRAFLETHRVGNWNDLSRRRERVLRVHLAAQRSDTLARLQTCDAVAKCFDHARRLESGRIGKIGLPGILPPPKERIGKVDSGRADLDQHHPGFNFGLRNLGDFQYFGSAKSIEYYCFHLLDLFVSRARWFLIFSSDVFRARERDKFYDARLSASSTKSRRSLPQ